MHVSLQVDRMKLSSLLIFWILFSEYGIQQTGVDAYRTREGTFHPEDVSFSFKSGHVEVVQQVSDPTEPSKNHSNVSNADDSMNDWPDLGIKFASFDGIGSEARDVSSPGDNSNDSGAIESFEARFYIENGSNSTDAGDTNYEIIEQDPHFADKAMDFFELTDPNSEMYLTKNEIDYPEFQSAESKQISIDKKTFLGNIYNTNKLSKNKLHQHEEVSGESNDFDTKTIEFLISPDSLSNFLQVNLSTVNVLHLVIFYNNDTGVEYVTKENEFIVFGEPVNNSKLKVIQISLKANALKNNPPLFSSYKTTNPKYIKVTCYFKSHWEYDIEKGPDCVYYPQKVDSMTKRFQHTTDLNTPLDEETTVDGHGTKSTLNSNQPNKITSFILKVLIYITGELFD